MKMVADAVVVEPISEANFPANREKNRESSCKTAAGGRFCALNSINCFDLRLISLSDRTGKFSSANRLRHFRIRDRTAASPERDSTFDRLTSVNLQRQRETPDLFTIGAQKANSSRQNFASSSEFFMAGVSPAAASICFCMSGRASIFFTAASRRSIASGGMPFGPKRAYQSGRTKLSSSGLLRGRNFGKYRRSLGVVDTQHAHLPGLDEREEDPD